MKKAKLEEAGIDFTELALAYDGLSVVVNPENDWAKDLTVEQLQKFGLKMGQRKSGLILIHLGQMKNRLLFTRY